MFNVALAQYIPRNVVFINIFVKTVLVQEFSIEITTSENK